MSQSRLHMEREVEDPQSYRDVSPFPLRPTLESGGLQSPSRVLSRDESGSGLNMEYLTCFMLKNSW